MTEQPDLVELRSFQADSQLPKDVRRGCGKGADEILRLRSQSEMRFKRMNFECEQHAKKCVKLADIAQHALVVESKLDGLLRAIAEKGGTEHAPTEWAYNRLSETLAKCKLRAESAEAVVKIARHYANNEDTDQDWEDLNTALDEYDKSINQEDT